MKRIRITAVKKAFHKDLAMKYENGIDSGCGIEEGMTWMSEDGSMPPSFCTSAWENLSKYVFALSYGGGSFFDNWMKNPRSAVISCNDGIRPVSFLLEVIDEEEK